MSESTENAATPTTVESSMKLNRIEPKKSPNDDRHHRYIELPNKLKVMLTHDAAADKASAALNVNIGAIHDPDDFPGLAHFCEHMLFLGTEKYPVENAYGKFLSEHGGWSNAFTDSHDTNYHFEVGWKQLEGALDRFAQFFHKPLFTEDCTDREVNAVQSEHEKNFKQDSRRLFQLGKHTSDPSHPYSRFPSGNKKTLKEDPEAKGLDTRKALLDFHEKYYSANIMGLSILGRHSLDELEAMVIAMFATIENKNVVSPTFQQHPNTGAYISQMIKTVPVRELRSLRLAFPIRDQTLNFSSQPCHLLGHLLGHEGAGSLLSFLKSKDWANSLMAGGFGGEIGSFSFFSIYIDMSESGLDKVNDIVEAVFQYITMLKASPLERWVFDECKKLLDMEFQFQEKTPASSLCTSTAKDLRVYPAEQVFSAHYDLVDFKPELVNVILDRLVPSNLQVTVINQKFEDQTNEVEPYYGTKFCRESLSEEQLQRWGSGSPNSELRYPDPNPFIPTNFDIKRAPASASVLPQLLLDSPTCKIWHKQDVTFKLPKGRIGVVLTSPAAYVDPKHAVMTRLFVDVWKDSVTEFAYDAELAGVHSNVRHTVDGIDLTVSGYHDKLPEYLYAIVERLLSLKIDADRFAASKDRYMRALRSFKMSEPISLSAFAMQRLLLHKSYTHEDLQQACEGVTRDDVQKFISVLLHRIHLECFVFGNFTESDARSILSGVESRFLNGTNPGPPLVPSERERSRLHKLEHPAQVLKKETDVHQICCVQMYMQVGLDNIQQNALLMLFCQLIQEHTFDVLRTQEQLGYNVYSTVWRSSGVRGLQISVQSNHPHEHVAKRIRAYVASLKEFLESMTEEQFKNHVDAISAMLLEKPKKMGDESRIYWNEIVQGFYIFDRRLLANDAVTSLTKADILEFYAHFVDQSSPTRRELLTVVSPAANMLDKAQVATTKAGVGHDDDDDDGGDGGDVNADTDVNVKATIVDSEEKTAIFEELLPGTIEIEDVDAFKRGLCLYPIPRPQEHALKPEVDAKADL